MLTINTDRRYESEFIFHEKVYPVDRCAEKVESVVNTSRQVIVFPDKGWHAFPTQLRYDDQGGEVYHAFT